MNIIYPIKLRKYFKGKGKARKTGSGPELWKLGSDPGFCELWNKKRRSEGKE